MSMVKSQTSLYYCKKENIFFLVVVMVDTVNNLIEYQPSETVSALVTSRAIDRAISIDCLDSARQQIDLWLKRQSDIYRKDSYNCIIHPIKRLNIQG